MLYITSEEDNRRIYWIISVHYRKNLFVLEFYLKTMTLKVTGNSLVCS